MMSALVSGLLAGCTKVRTECVWSDYLQFGSMDTVEWLLENDRKLLTDIVVHNESRERICR